MPSVTDVRYWYVMRGCTIRAVSEVLSINERDVRVLLRQAHLTLEDRKRHRKLYLKLWAKTAIDPNKHGQPRHRRDPEAYKRYMKLLMRYLRYNFPDKYPSHKY